MSRPFTVEEMGPIAGNISRQKLKAWREEQQSKVSQPQQLDFMRHPIFTKQKDVKLLDTSEFHGHRHQFRGYVAICGAIESGQIVKAMTLLERASQAWAQVRQGALARKDTAQHFAPHIIDDLIGRILHLRHKSEQAWSVLKLKVPEGDHWSPACLRFSRGDLEDTSVLDLSFFALMDLYDMAGCLGIVPSTTSTAKFLMSISTVLNEQTFTQAVFTVLLRLDGKSLEEARIIVKGSPSEAIDELNFDKIPQDLMRGIVNCYGNLKLPHVGETLLSRWASAKAKVGSHAGPDDEHEIAVNTWRKATDVKRGSIGEPVWIDSSAWCSDARLWASLVTSRARASDLAGARHWLQVFRDAGLGACKAANANNCHEPYVAYLLACTRIRKKDVFEDDLLGRDARPDAWIAGGITRLNAIRDIINTMHEDGTGFPTRVGVMLINILLNHRLEKEALPLIRLLETKKIEDKVKPHHTKALLRQSKLTARKDFSPLAQPVEQDEYWQEQELNDDAVRAMFFEFLATKPSVWNTWSVKVKRDVLNNIFATALAIQDLPVITRLLRLFVTLSIGPDHRTELLMGSLLAPDTLEQFEARQKHQVERRVAKMQRKKGREERTAMDDDPQIVDPAESTESIVCEHHALTDPRRGPSAEYQRERLRTWIRFVDQAIVFTIRSTTNEVLEHFRFSRWVKHGRKLLDTREDSKKRKGFIDDRLVKKLIRDFYNVGLDKVTMKSVQEMRGGPAVLSESGTKGGTKGKSCVKVPLGKTESESLLGCSLSMS